MGPTILFTHLKIILLQCFQFSATISSIQTDPTMHLQGVLDKIMCKAFPTTLKGLAQVWFNKIPLNNVGSFEELSKLFANNFIEG